MQFNSLGSEIIVDLLLKNGADFELAMKNDMMSLHTGEFSYVPQKNLNYLFFYSNFSYLFFFVTQLLIMVWHLYDSKSIDKIER